MDYLPNFIKNWCEQFVGRDDSVKMIGCKTAIGVGSSETFSDFTKTFCKSENVSWSTTLKEALDTFSLNWLLLHLDESYKSVQKGIKNKDEHDAYFNSLIKKVKQLSLTYHPDKVTSQTTNKEDAQKLINLILTGLRNVHTYVIENVNVMNCEILYRLYGEVPLKIICGDNQDIFRQIDPTVFDVLYDIARNKEGRLMSARNEYLNNIKKFISEMKTFDRWITAKDVFDMQKTKMGLIYQNYVDSYLYYLRNLNAVCEQCKIKDELSVLKPEVEKLLNEGHEHYNLFYMYRRLKWHKIKKPEELEGNVDEIYGRAILDYHACGYMHRKFAILYHQHKSIRIVTNMDALKKAESFIKNLLYGELMSFTHELLQSLCENKVYEWNSLLRKKCGARWNVDIEDVATISVCALYYLRDMLDKRFVNKDTLFQREHREKEAMQARLKKMNEEIKDYQNERKQAYNSIAESHMAISKQYEEKSEMFSLKAEMLQHISTSSWKTNTELSILYRDAAELYHKSSEFHDQASKMDMNDCDKWETIINDMDALWKRVKETDRILADKSSAYATQKQLVFSEISKQIFNLDEEIRLIFANFISVIVDQIMLYSDLFEDNLESLLQSIIRDLNCSKDVIVSDKDFCVGVVKDNLLVFKSLLVSQSSVENTYL